MLVRKSWSNQLTTIFARVFKTCFMIIFTKGSGNDSLTLRDLL